ncbi:hypothetical protein [Eubacterium sp. 1001713B170207_170306_E7]|uniref:hypothetical protein n=1 Tax=Eubacterium sp. 1001713B170207_170306_E7 TaxID=2787097 RepID=UPI00189AF9EF|nr:hypothetical protein [Eubacterium sp. 1001713B170207_170306_E7]
MTWFTDSPFEKMMTQRPRNGRHKEKPPVSHSPACEACPYKGIAPCVGYCIKKIQKQENTEPER